MEIKKEKKPSDEEVAKESDCHSSVSVADKKVDKACNEEQQAKVEKTDKTNDKSSCCG